MTTTYTYTQLVESLRAIGLGQGDTVHVHSGLFGLGPMAGVRPEDIPTKVYQALREVIGPRGTLTVPASFDDYARCGTPYDCHSSPVDRAQGVFSQYVTGLSEAVRTYCPMSAVSGVGPLAYEICHVWTGSAFGTGCAWDKLYETDCKMCFIGIPPCYAFTFTGFIQFRFGVPHLYNKIFTVPIYEDGKELPLAVVAAVRYLNPTFRIIENCEPFQSHLCEKKMIQMARVGRGMVYNLLSARAVFEEGTRMLQKNLYFFCKERPGFVPGEIPMDGPTGAYVSNEQRYADRHI